MTDTTDDAGRNAEARAVIDRLDSLLEAERRALLAGDLGSIATILARKEDLIDKLGRLDRAAAPGLAALEEKAARNQALMDSALGGIRRTAARMAAFRRIRRSLETYDRSGRKTEIRDGATGSADRRA